MFRFVLTLIPTIAMLAAAQTPAPAPPPEVDQALRARVSEFFQDYVDAHFRQGEALVAEDSKDYYYNSPKTQFKSFKIDGVSWAADFSKARVIVVVERTWEVQPALKSLSVVPLATSWKIENGKWVWFNDPAPDAWVTPMGPSDVKKLQKDKQEADSVVPKDLSQAAIQAQAKQILMGAGTLDKTFVNLLPDKDSSDQVVFTNQSSGPVKLSVEGSGVNGVTAVLDKTDLGAGEKATLKVSYTPMGKQPPVAVGIRVEPFQKLFVVRIKTS